MLAGYVKSASEIALIMVLLAAAASAQVTNSRSLYDEFVSLSIFPFEKTGDASKEIDLRSKVIQALGKSAVMDYLIHSPENGELNELYAAGFSRRKDRTYWPAAEYWRKNPIKYVVFGSYSTGRNGITADLFLYDTKDGRLLIHKKYRAPISELSELGATISRSIEESLTELPKNRGRIKDSGTKK